MRYWLNKTKDEVLYIYFEFELGMRIDFVVGKTLFDTLRKMDFRNIPITKDQISEIESVISMFHMMRQLTELQRGI